MSISLWVGAALSHSPWCFSCNYSVLAVDNPMHYAGYAVNTTTDAHMTTPLSDDELRKREDYIRGRPPRVSALPAEQRTQRQQALLDEMSMVVVDGVRKPREDLPALEILIRHAELYKAHMEVAHKFLSDCEMPIRDRELAILRLAWLSQAPFEWGAHVKIARRNGVTAEEITRVMQGSAAPGWSRQDRGLVRAIEELHFDSMITDETWADLQTGYNEKKLIELVILAGQYKTVAYYQNALRLPLPESSMGLFAR
jgi:alkylhydroperoxidase family enzyme